MSIKSFEAYGVGLVPSSCWSRDKRDAACALRATRERSVWLGPEDGLILL